MIYISKELYLYISYVIKKKKDKKQIEKQQPEKTMYKMYKHEGMLSIIGGRGGGDNIWVKYHESSY